MNNKTTRISRSKAMFCAALLLSGGAGAQTTITQKGAPINLDASLKGCSDSQTKCIEASGLSLSNNGNTLWTVNDANDFTQYKMQLDGSRNSGTFSPTSADGDIQLRTADFEGVTYACRSGDDCSKNHFIYVVDEKLNAIIPMEYHDKTYFDYKKIGDMSGAMDLLPDEEVFGICRKVSLQDCLDNPADGKHNSGLEGITYSPVHNSFFVLKEKHPGLLIRVSADLNRVEQVWAMDLGQNADYSGIAFDPSRCKRSDDCKIWVISDEAEKVYLLNLSDWSIDNETTIKSCHIVASQALGHKCSEGVAYDAKAKRLYIATDGGKGGHKCGFTTDKDDKTFDHSYLFTYEVKDSSH
ncbi:MAG: SdiA-regulated domain-containing protein [Gammaproteobacteria bacterium]|nr:SdiA-regulated domain-containing protein [Gammaproteobacteria bacterium]